MPSPGGEVMSGGGMNVVSGSSMVGETSTPPAYSGVHGGRITTPYPHSVQGGPTRVAGVGTAVAGGTNSTNANNGGREAWGVPAFSTLSSPIPAFQQQSFMLRSPGFMQQPHLKNTPESSNLSIKVPPLQNLDVSASSPLSLGTTDSNESAVRSSALSGKRVRWADENDGALEEVREPIRYCCCCCCSLFPC